MEHCCRSLDGRLSGKLHVEFRLGAERSRGHYLRAHHPRWWRRNILSEPHDVTLSLRCELRGTSSSVSVFVSVSVSFLNNLTFYLSPLSSPPSLSSVHLLHPSPLSYSCSTRQFETRRRRLGLEWSELNGMEM